MRFSKTIIVILLVIGVLVLVKFTVLTKNVAKPSTTATPGAAPVVAVSAVVVKPQKLDQIIYASGTVLANEEVELRPEASGKITQLLFKEGSHVKKGSLLVKINDADLQAALKKEDLQIKLAEDRLK